MKKTILVFLFVWGWSISAHADSLLGFGFKGGLSVSQENISNLPITMTSLLAPTGGIFTDLHLLDFFSFQLETNYVQKGAAFSGLVLTSSPTTFPPKFENGNAQFAFNYIEVPLLCKVQKNLAPDLKLFLLAGPSLSFLLNQTTTVTAPGYNNSYNYTSQYMSTYWSMDFGGGVELAGFLLDIRYGLGLSNGGQLNTLSFQAGYRLF